MSTPIRYSRPKFLSCLFHISLTADRPQRARLPPVPPTATLPSCLWPLSLLSKDLPISPRFSSYKFLSRCKFSTLTVRHVIVGFYLLLRYGSQIQIAIFTRKTRTHDSAQLLVWHTWLYLLDHSGDDCIVCRMIRDRAIELYSKKNLNASRPSEHPPVRGGNIKTFRWDHCSPGGPLI